jgi:hypothetical protein
MSDTREKRTRQLTIKGQTMFDEQQEQLENIRQLNKDIEAYYKTFVAVLKNTKDIYLEPTL